jgi:hypothetical protein
LCNVVRLARTINGYRVQAPDGAKQTSEMQIELAERPKEPGYDPPVLEER